MINIFNIALLAPFVPIVFAFAGSLPAADLPPRRAEQKQFSVIGIEVRTNNSRERSGQGEIPKQWERFFREGVLGKIPGKADSNIVVVYFNYQSGKTGDYDYLIGARVNDASTVPPGMRLKTIPSGRYAIVTTAIGPVGKVVADAWQKIWSLDEKSGLGGIRAYEADFEIYDDRSRDPKNSRVDIYVGLK